jgi:hypothetical protein
MALEDEGKPYTLGELLARFKGEMGHDLRLEDAGGVLDLGDRGGGKSAMLSTAPEERKRYGEFRFVISLSDSDEPSLDFARLPSGKPDANGP